MTPRCLTRTASHQYNLVQATCVTLPSGELYAFNTAILRAPFPAPGARFERSVSVTPCQVMIDHA